MFTNPVFCIVVVCTSPSQFVFPVIEHSVLYNFIAYCTQNKIIPRIILPERDSFISTYSNSTILVHCIDAGSPVIVKFQVDYTCWTSSYFIPYGTLFFFKYIKGLKPDVKAAMWNQRSLCKRWAGKQNKFPEVIQDIQDLNYLKHTQKLGFFLRFEAQQKAS